MRRPRFGIARPSTGALLLVIGLVGGMFTVLAPQAQAASISQGVLGGFDNDGDQEDLAEALPIDWQRVKIDPRITQWALIHDDNDVDTTDFTQINSAKEHDPSAWGCAANEAPPKDDLFRLYLASQVTAADQFLHIGYVRDTAVGDTDINVEFNKNTAQFSCPGDTGGRVRSTGDLLISFTFSGGRDPSVIELYRWAAPAAGVDDDFIPADGHWNLVTGPIAAAGADNAASTIIDHFYEGATLAKRTFGEVTLDLGSLFDDGLLSCPGLGFATVHSRASHSFASDLKDVFPETPFNLSNCGSLKLKKVNDLLQPMAGVTFGLYQNDNGVPGTPVRLPGTSADLTCLTDAAGVCFFPLVPPGSYLIAEVDLPADYIADPDLPLAVTIGAFSNVDLSDSQGEWIVNSRRPDLRVTKTGNGPINAGDPVNLARYTITLTSVAGPARHVTFDDVLPAGLAWVGGTGFPSDCEIKGTTTLTLSCEWEDFPDDTPVVITVQAPVPADPAVCPQITNQPSDVVAADEAAGTLADNTTGTVVIGVRCPDLQLVKGPDADSVSRGDPIGFLIKVWNEGDGVVFDARVSDPLPAGFNWDLDLAGSDLPDGASCVVDDATHTLSCTLGDLPGGSSEASPAAVIHVVAVDVLALPCGPYTNTATAVADNDPGGTDDALVTLLCPGVNIVKAAADDLVEAGDEIGYTLEVTNAGPGEAKGVTVTDDLPGDLAWAVDSAGSDLPDGATCAIAAGVLTCQLGDLPATTEAPQVAIHLTAGTDVPTGNAGIGDCGNYPNIAAATPANGLADRSETVDVDVRCPLDIEVTKTGEALAHVGDTVTYQFTVTNMGFVDLVGAVLTDSICVPGTVVRVGDGDGDDRLEIDVDADAGGLQREVWNYTCARAVRLTDPDPLPNTATVRGTDIDGRTTDDTASWVVDLIHPAIEVVKTVDDVDPSVGQTVTYTYVVTNTGDTALSTVLVTDNILGAIGTVATLAPGASTILTKTMVVTAGSPPENIGTAVGTDVLGKQVTDDDDAFIAVVLGVALVLPAVIPEVLPAVLPVTGSPARPLALIGLTMVLLGVFLHQSRRGHRLT